VVSDRVETIVVGVDGSEASRRAFEWATHLARALDAGVVAVHAVGLVEHRDDPNHARVHEWLAQLAAPDVLVERVVREGDPTIVVESVVAERGAQLVVVGTRGLGALGSTSTRLVERSAVPVTVVPPATGTTGSKPTRRST
jgi:nucleotide-binding universal stress UspA family protein